MRDGLVTLPSLGQAAGEKRNGSVKVLNICLPIYYNPSWFSRQATKLEYFYLKKMGLG